MATTISLAVHQRIRRIQKKEAWLRPAVRAIYQQAFGQEFPEDWRIGHGGNTATAGITFLDSRYLGINLELPRFKRCCVIETVVHELTHMHYNQRHADATDALFYARVNEHLDRLGHRHGQGCADYKSLEVWK